MDLKQKEKTLVILMPMVWSIRNYILAGVLNNLAGVKNYLLVRKDQKTIFENISDDLTSQVSGCETLIKPKINHRIKGLAFFKEVVDCAFSRRNHIGSYKIYQRWFNQDFSFSQRVRKLLINLLGFFSSSSIIFFRLCDFYNFLYKREFDISEIKNQLQLIKPDLILSTVNVETTYERAYILAAKELKIPVVNSILSFDNLTSKSAHLIYDYYLVWNQRMKDQLLSFYPQVRDDQVSVTGTPQFDFHKRVDCKWGNLKTLKRLGLNEREKYFIYGASTEKLTPEEPNLVLHLARKMQEDDLLKNYWLVVRTHPRDDWSRWKLVQESQPKLLISEAWDNEPDSTGWSLLTIDDQARLISSLAYAEGCINIASTITFDAAILDRPVIGIRFENEPDAPHNILYEEYDTDHYHPLVDSGGLRLAHSWKELISLMHLAIKNPELDREARARMVAQECGQVDGNAAERVTDALLTCLEQVHG